mgnify:CR=1 FL=1
MANIILEQQPKYNPFPVAQETIFAVSENAIVASETRVKFNAYVYVNWDKSALGTADTLVATLKTTPNNAGVGMFDLRPVLESFVNSDNVPNWSTNLTYSSIPGWNTGAPKFKTTQYNNIKQFPVHLIDQYSWGANTISWLKIKFKIEYLGADASFPNIVSEDADFLFTGSYLFYNGYLSRQDALTSSTYSNNFGWNLESAGFDFGGSTINYIQNSPTSRFLTNCPSDLYARISDYGTIAMFNTMDRSFTTGAPQSGTCRVDYIEVKMYNSSGAQIGSTFEVGNISFNGGYHNIEPYAPTKYLFAGVFPANLRGWSTDFQGQTANIDYYTVQAFGANHTAITKIYNIHIICDNSFGYEGIRLAWLNKFGAWDYYTFNQKSVRSISTKKEQYTQLAGSWNEAVYRPHGYKGGRKNFRVNAKESIKLNTDYLNDVESIWMEELLNSPEVYIINEYSSDDSGGIINKYVEPVLLTTSSFTRKTKANDKLIQYTIDVERTTDLRTQSV